jgi:hypothetical protein
MSHSNMARILEERFPCLNVSKEAWPARFRTVIDNDEEVQTRLQRQEEGHDGQPQNQGQLLACESDR